MNISNIYRQTKYVSCSPTIYINSGEFSSWNNLVASYIIMVCVIV